MIVLLAPSKVRGLLWHMFVVNYVGPVEGSVTYAGALRGEERMLERKLFLKCTTLRDGAQNSGVEVTSVPEALQIIEEADRVGVKYHEAGFPQAGTMDEEIIRAACKLELQGQVAGFGRTHRECVEKLIQLHQECGLPVAVMVGKSRLRDAEKALRSTPERCLDLIRESVAALVAAGLEVIYDAEHFFDGFHNKGRDHALETIKVALEAGARWIVLCDTNGGMTPGKVREAIEAVLEFVPGEKLGIHTHNDRGRAVANAETAVEAGVTLVEGTFGGFGERTGNLDLCTFMPNAYLDLGVTNITEEQLARLRHLYLLVCDVFNASPRKDQPYVGRDAFKTKSGMHASGEERDEGSYLHVDPGLVGNIAGFLCEDAKAGRANIAAIAAELGIEIPPDKLVPVAAAYQQAVNDGVAFGEASASLHLLLLRALGEMPKIFEVRRWRVIVDSAPGKAHTDATVWAAEEENGHPRSADGPGPVDALNQALMFGLSDTPALNKVRLVDFKVRIVEGAGAGETGTRSKVRVLITFTDGKRTWSTVAVNVNIITAAFEALLEGYRYEMVVGQESAQAA